MATQVRQFTVTIPAGTAKATPVTIPLSMDYVEIESVDLEVPPGPSGLMSFYLARSGQQVIPYETGEWLTWDDVQKTWFLTDQPTASGWQVVGYNTGAYDHDITVRFHVNPPSASSTTAPPSLTFSTSGVSSALVML